MINDLAYIIDLMCKFFADYTTLGDVDKDPNTVTTYLKYHGTLVENLVNVPWVINQKPVFFRLY